MPRMPRPSPPPPPPPASPPPRPGPPRRGRLAETERLLVDGSNLLHALRRGANPPPAATLIGRVRAVIEPGVRIELVFDGPAAGSVGDSRVATGLTVRYSGRVSADTVITRLVSEAANPAALLVVTDDAELTARVRRAGGRTARTEWLMARLERTTLVAPSVGRPRPPRAPLPPAVSPDEARDDDRPRWQPGRGATAKRGNPRRRPRTGGGPAG